ncbi:AI-2E family transporter [Algoriphagus aquimarinus]|uniref:Predicted PurR-regulated permease PerM n=1 Tax=Algoriphagus aquimarinus TaxID=237018 RepID=A0A1I0WA70_9BACT|nr:AI-2E family transporter [Algoriphagus aquimarinus]SFA85484.1 Predicted PurR-regulated permease PerM [Algoriphagus aquimarinus]
MKAKEILLSLALLILGTYFLIKGLVISTSFLVPIAFASLLTLICIPLSRKMEIIGISRGLASFLCVVVSFVSFLAFFWVISAQISNISERWPEAKKTLKPKLESTQQFIREKTGISTQEQMKLIYGATEENPESSTSEKPQADKLPDNSEADSSELLTQGAKKKIGIIVMDFFGFLGSAMLTFIYLFFFLFYRRKVKLSILKFFDPEKRSQAQEVMGQSIQLSVNFLVGRLTLILFLAIIYSAGLMIAGVDNAILISLIAAVLSLIPYLGVIIGYVLAISMTAFSGAETWSLMIVTFTYGLAQFIESYILEPYVVGDKVNLNPLITIVVVVLGGSVWGVSGMILSIPLAGILKIIFDATDALKPLGYALGVEDIDSSDKQGVLSRWGENIWNKFKKIPTRKH